MRVLRSVAIKGISVETAIDGANRIVAHRMRLSRRGNQHIRHPRTEDFGVQTRPSYLISPLVMQTAMQTFDMGFTARGFVAPMDGSYPLLVTTRPALPRYHSVTPREPLAFPLSWKREMAPRGKPLQ